jgi:hypothetical protein
LKQIFMTNALAARFVSALFVPATAIAISLTAPGLAKAESQRVYHPIPLPESNEVSDTLTDKDIPTGEGGFARDYTVKLEAKDQVSIDLTSESFDTIVTLMKDGVNVGQNDDGSDGSTNSLLFTRIKEAGIYTVRVRAFGEAAGGSFKLKVTRLRPI